MHKMGLFLQKQLFIRSLFCGSPYEITTDLYQGLFGEQATPHPQDALSPMFFLPLCCFCERSGGLKGPPDHIPDYDRAKPGQADPGKTAAE